LRFEKERLPRVAVVPSCVASDIPDARVASDLDVLLRQ